MTPSEYAMVMNNLDNFRQRIFEQITIFEDENI